MGGKSLHTELQHQRVWTLYEAKLREAGQRASSIKRSTYHEEISEETGYSVVAVRKIINAQVRRRTDHPRELSNATY